MFRIDKFSLLLTHEQRRKRRKEGRKEITSGQQR